MQRVQIRHFEVVDGWQKNLIQVQKSILNRPGKSQEENKWQYNILAFFPPMSVKFRFRQKKARLNRSLSLFLW